MDVVRRSLIKTKFKADSKNQVLEAISDVAFKEGIVKDRNLFYEGLIEREKEFSTGIGNGFAIPHCKNNVVLTPSVIVFKLSNTILWESTEDEEVKIIFALAVPEDEAGTTHIKLLSKIARALIDTEFSNGLHKVDSVEEIYSMLIKKVS